MLHKYYSFLKTGAHVKVSAHTDYGKLEGILVETKIIATSDSQKTKSKTIQKIKAEIALRPIGIEYGHSGNGWTLRSRVSSTVEIIQHACQSKEKCLFLQQLKISRKNSAGTIWRLNLRLYFIITLGPQLNCWSSQQFQWKKERKIKVTRWRRQIDRSRRLRVLNFEEKTKNFWLNPWRSYWSEKPTEFGKDVGRLPL